MKKAFKSQEPLKLQEYIKDNPSHNWKDFKDTCQDGYKEVIEQIRVDQSGLCCYCELNFCDEVNIRDDFRVEHFHPKSDSSEEKNWDLDWKNLLGCCHGGSEKRTIDGESRFIENKSHRHSDILKADCIWDEEILNPLEVPAFPPIFHISTNGKMKVIEENLSPEMLIKAIGSLDENKLNLNSPNLKEWRKIVIDNLREEVSMLVESSGNIANAVNIVINAQLSRNNKGNHPKFFSTIRSYFKDDAESYLLSIGYEG